jgi:hypothetical protein
MIEVIKDGARIRTRPSTDSKIVVTVPAGAQLTLVEDSNGWGKVQYRANGKIFSGWIRGDLVGAPGTYARMPHAPNPTPSHPRGPLKLVAHYPLQSDGVDVTGKQGDINLTNSTFEAGSARVLGYSADDPYANQVITPRLTGIDRTNLAISIEFYALESAHQPILITGTACRWLGTQIDKNGMLELVVNNSEHTASNERVTPQVWHTITMRYDGHVVELEYDGATVVTRSVWLNSTCVGLHDFEIGTANDSWAGALNGNVRNLRVYSD